MKENNKVDLSNKVHIAGQYYMGADDRQYTLYWVRESTSKKTDETYETTSILGYFGDIPYLLKSCIAHTIRRKIQNGEIDTIKELMKQYINKLDEFEEVYKSLK